MRVGEGFAGIEWKNENWKVRWNKKHSDCETHSLREFYPIRIFFFALAQMSSGLSVCCLVFTFYHIIFILIFTVGACLSRHTRLRLKMHTTHGDSWRRRWQKDQRQQQKRSNSSTEAKQYSSFYNDLYDFEKESTSMNMATLAFIETRLQITDAV